MPEDLCRYFTQDTCKCYKLSGPATDGLTVTIWFFGAVILCIFNVFKIKSPFTYLTFVHLQVGHFSSDIFQWLHINARGSDLLRPRKL